MALILWWFEWNGRGLIETVVIDHCKQFCIHLHVETFCIWCRKVIFFLCSCYQNNKCTLIINICHDKDLNLFAVTYFCDCVENISSLQGLTSTNIGKLWQHTKMFQYHWVTRVWPIFFGTWFKIYYYYMCGINN